MAIRTVKQGGRIRVTKESSMFHRAVLGAAWKRRQDDGATFDVDLGVALTGADGHCSRDSDLVYWDALVHPSRSVVHHGDDLEGSDDGEEPSEVIDINLQDVPDYVEQIRIFAMIYRARQRKQSFADIERARITLEGDADDVIRFDLESSNITQPVIQVGMLERHPEGWDFQADTKPYESFEDYIADLGLEAGE